MKALNFAPRLPAQMRASAPWFCLLSLAAVSACSQKAAEDGTPSKNEKAFAPDATVERDHVPDEYKWKLDPLFPNDDAFRSKLAEVEQGIAEAETLCRDLRRPQLLLNCLKTYFDLRLATNELTLYANLRFDTDGTSTELQAMRDASLGALDELMRLSSIIRKQVMALEEATIARAYRTVPALVELRPYLKELRRRKGRVLSGEAERLMSLAGDNLWAEIDLNEIPSDFEKIFQSLLTDIPLPTIRDEEYREVTLTLSSYPRYRGSKVRRVRREAVESFFATLKQYQHAFASTLAGQAGLSVFFARARGYDSALEAYLDKENIAPTVYTNLIEAIHANLEPLHDYVRLRKQVMNVDEVHIYDLYTPLVAKADMEIPYSEAQEILPAALAPLGDEYVRVLNEGLDLEKGWVDVYPHAKKASGAFSASTYGIHPFIKMNYYDSFTNLSTLAHEFGHAMHSHFSGEHQPYVTFNYSPFIAEIASTMNEKLLFDHLFAQAENDTEKLYLLNHLLEKIRTTIYRQTLFAEFELALHRAVERGTPVTAELLNSTYRDLVERYYGPDFTVGPNDDIEWAYVPHFYYKFYMYTYATGLSAGIALAQRVTRGGDAERDAYLGMLAAGSSKPPLDILKDAGVDLTSPKAVEAAARLMASTIEKMRELLPKTTVAAQSPAH